MNEKNVPQVPINLDDYNLIRKNNVPMYNPKTGDPNPNYEKLTGHKNPLQAPRVSKMGMLIPEPYEPKVQNRWLVTFPEEFKISPYFVVRTERPTYTRHVDVLFGFYFRTRPEWCSITMTLNDPVEDSISRKLMRLINIDNPKTFTYALEMLDPTGVSVERWLIKDCVIQTIVFGGLDYCHDSLVEITMTIKPNDVELIY